MSDTQKSSSSPENIADTVFQKLKQGQTPTEPLTPEIEKEVNAKIDTLKEDEKKPIQEALAKLKQQTEKQQNKRFSDSLKEIIDKNFTAIEVAYFIKTTELVNQYVNEEMKKHPEKASGLKGTAGWLLLTRLEESGYYPRIILENTQSSAKKHIIRVDTKNRVDQSKATAIANALNNQLDDIRDGLEYALMWKSSEFANFAQSSLGADGKINPKADLLYGKYVQDAQKKGLLKSDADRAFLDSLTQMPSASNPESMKQAITGYIQFQESVAGIQKKLQNDPKVKEELEKAAKNGQEKSTSVPSSSETSTRMTAKMTSEVDGKTGQSIGNFVGKAARGSVSGLFGGMGDLLKMGGGDPIATVVIGGGLLYGIYKAFKEFGFFGGIGALLGFGAINNSEAIFGKDTSSKGKEEKPGESSPTPALPGVVISGGFVQNPNEITPQNNLTPEQAFHANLLTLPVNTSSEKLQQKMNPIDTLANVPFSLLQNALKQNGGTDAQKKAWDAVRTSVNYDSVSDTDKKKFDTAINPENINAVNQYVQSLVGKEGTKKALTKLPNITLENLANAVRREEEKHSPPQPSPELANQIQAEVTILNEQYGPMVALARMIEYGYLPKINFSIAEVASKEGWIPRIFKGLTWVALGTGLTAQAPKETILTGKGHKEAEETLAKWSKWTVNEEKILLKKLQKESIGVDTKNKPLIDAQNIDARAKKLAEVEALFTDGKIPSGKRADLKRLMNEYQALSGVNPIDLNRKLKEKSLQEIETVKELDRINTEIEKAQKEIIEALEKANKEPTPENIKAAQDLTAKKNALIVELEGKGVQNLSKMNISQIEALTHTNPWVAKIVKFNGKIDKVNEWLGKNAGGKAGKTILGVGIVALVWNSKGSISEMFQKGDWANLAKAGWDFGAGVVPILSTVHESAILANSNGFGIFGTGYRDFILGKGYEMGKLETGFRAVGAIPLAGLGTKVVGKTTIAVGEKMASKTTMTVGKGIIESSSAGVKIVQTGAQLGTYGVLGYSAVTGVYDLAIKK